MATRSKKAVIPDYKVKLTEDYPVYVVVIEAVIEAPDMEAEDAIGSALDELMRLGYALTVRKELIDHTIKEACDILYARHKGC